MFFLLLEESARFCFFFFIDDVVVNRWSLYYGISYFLSFLELYEIIVRLFCPTAGQNHSAFLCISCQFFLYFSLLFSYLYVYHNASFLRIHYKECDSKLKTMLRNSFAFVYIRVSSSSFENARGFGQLRVPNVLIYYHEIVNIYMSCHFNH